jgi:hypothetical protein
VPYAVHWATAPEGSCFTGLVFNPQDGLSYLAKMHQGMRGSWRFRLTFTPEPHAGAPVYLFYLLLGHIACRTGLPLIAVYHIVRAAGGALMLLAIYVLACKVDAGEVGAPASQGQQRIMFLLASLGAGLGWLLGPLGAMTSDLWVAEAFPVYALQVNAHFPLSVALMAFVALCGIRVSLREQKAGATGGELGRRTLPWGVGLVSGAVLLSAVQPFGLVGTFGGLAAMLVAHALRERALPWRATGWTIGAGVAALPYPLYMLWAIRSDPVLAAWNRQNVTPSPPLWDWAASYGLVLLLALVGAAFAARRGGDGDWLLLGWAGVTLAGMYLPLPLRRRLSLGLGLPLGLLAGMGWWRRIRPRITHRRRGLAQGVVVAFSALTPLFLVLSASVFPTPWSYLSQEEWLALDWLRTEGEADSVVLSSPHTGALVPALSGQRVVYGHPFETLDAERRRAQVKAFWHGGMGPEEKRAFLAENRVRYLFIGPSEMQIWDGDLDLPIALEVVYTAPESGSVKVYGLHRR